MEIEYVLKDDYNKKEKINKEGIFCYSKKKLNKIYPDKDYKVVGEISGKCIDPSEQKEDDKVLNYHGKCYVVDSYGTANKLIYGRNKFICVGNDEYVVLLNDRITFIILLLLISLGIILSMVFILNFGNKLLNPIPEIDPNLDKIEGDTSERVESEEGGGSLSIAYSLDAHLSMETEKIEMYLENPNASNHQFAAEMYIENGEKDVCIAKSGLISPGYCLETMEFNGKAVLSSGTYDGYYRLKIYNPETGELALIETKIEDLEIAVD